MSTIDKLDREALLLVAEAVELFFEATFESALNDGDDGDYEMTRRRLHGLCGEHGVDVDEAISTFAP
ncbi:hypothetical protein KGD82_16490 [Nocardiopsis eucommiae]|uniref:Uncharacterized protein n=1 Tax=Nocardiopsis eucommiae TaxID=2831970 RepID=A0A975L865_9ACTN|nr:hypothetical protein KGD82_16490 [Nocardiopsis eucommiae]